MPTTPNPYAALSDAELQRLADQRVDAALAPQQAEIQRQQAAAAARALADRQALAGIGVAGASLMAGIGPGIQGGYDAAARALGDLAGGFSAGAAARVRAQQEAGRAFVAANAPGSGQDGGPNVGDLQDVLYGLGGFIPAGSLETQGAAANRWGQVLPGIEQRATEISVQERMAQGDVEDREYRQQLIDLAKQRPDLRAQIVDELYRHELDKLNARLAQQDAALRRRAQALAEKQAKQDAALKERAQRLYERQFGETVRSHKAGEAISYAGLQLRNAQAVADAKAAEAQGRRIDAPASRVAGYLIDKNGNAIIGRNGKPVPIAKPAGKQTAAQKNEQAAVREARALRGNPVRNTSPTAGLPGHGKYVARPGVKGVFPDGTTNNAALARRDGAMTFVEARDYLMTAYGLSRADARAALVAAGWRPDTRRPRKATGGYDRKTRG